MAKIRISVIGTRGFPQVQGGVEKHCEILYPLVCARGCEVTVYRRKPYINGANNEKEFRSVKFKDVWTVRQQSLEAILHSLIASFGCIVTRPDLVHIHNIGPALVIPILKASGIRIVVTYHSQNYQHQKWGRYAKKLLKLGEFFATRMADHIIHVSQGQMKKIPGRSKSFIPNGVFVPTPSSSTDFIDRLGIIPNQYILAVGRLTPEKGFDDLVRAFSLYKGDQKLVIAGDADQSSNYSEALLKLASSDSRIVMTGFISGEPLKQVYGNASLFVLPSRNEGLPIALLEALSYGLPVVASDIPANRELSLPEHRYFECGNISELAMRMESCLKRGISVEEREEMMAKIIKQYDWNLIADETVRVYRQVLER